MANQITDNRTSVAVAKTSTPASETWTGSTSPSEDTEIFIEGDTSIAEHITNSRRSVMFDAGSAQNWSSNVFYIWINCGIVGLLDTKANGGFRIRFAGATITDFFEVNVGGNDVWPVAIQGGWAMFVVDIEDAHTNSDATGGTKPATNAIRYVGYSAITTSMTRVADNTWIDAIWRLPDGTPGIIVEGRNGGTTDWNSADIATQLGVSSGLFIDIGVGGAYKINAPIQFGINDTTTHGFTDTNAIWLWEDQEFVPADLYGISALGNSGGVTNVTFGVKTGTGDDATGAQGLIIAAAPTGARWFMDFDDPDLDSIDLYGCSFQHGATFDLDDPAVECISNLYIDCSQANVSNSLQLRNSVINANTADGVAFMHTDDMGDIRFGTFEFSDGHAIEILSGGPATQTNKGNLFSGYTNTAGSNDAAIYNNSAAARTINNTEGSNLNVNSYRNGTSATTTIQNSVTVTITVQDTAGNPIQGARVFLEESPGGADVITYDTTNASGQVTTTFSGSTPQAVVGFVRKGGYKPVYKASPINDTIGTGGLSATVTLVADE